MLRTRADCVVVRTRRHLAFLANIYERCLLTQQVDDLADETAEEEPQAIITDVRDFFRTLR